MTPSKLPELQIVQFAEWVADYIVQQRDAFLVRAEPIKSAHRELLQNFFPADVLAHVKVARTPQ
jgi:hypothetical protein